MTFFCLASVRLSKLVGLVYLILYDTSDWSDWSDKLTKLMGFSHLFTLSPFHPFTFKRRQPSFYLFTFTSLFTFKYVSDKRELGMQGWQSRVTNLQNTAGTAQPCIMPKIS